MSAAGISGPRLAGCLAVALIAFTTLAAGAEPTEATASTERREAGGPPPAVELASGVRYVDLAAGNGGPARRGHRVTVHLEGALETGEVVVSTRERQRPMRFRLGDGEVIRGLEDGLEGMRAGGRRRIFVPAEAAYGRRGAGGRIPPDASLVFVVELLEIR